MPLEPATPEDLSEAIRALPRCLVVGARTKERLSRVRPPAELLSTRNLSGIVDYDPGEFTFTALAGTPLRLIAETLGHRRQYLPFDPPLIQSGATIGGTVASGLSGPGRFRFGGLRDFILAVRFATGTGEILRGGAKVVKNAAGFDIPKFLAGNLGRFGVLLDMTFKVFPAPPSLLTVRIDCPSPMDAQEKISESANSRWELDALDYSPRDNAIYARLGGPAAANEALAREIARRWGPSLTLPEAESAAIWQALNELELQPSQECIIKVPITLRLMPALVQDLQAVPGSCIHISAAGNTAWISLTAAAAFANLDDVLRRHHLRGLVLRGDTPAIWAGTIQKQPIEDRLLDVFDPERRFAVD